MRNIILILITSLALSDSYKEPDYALIDKSGNIEIRQYSENIIAKTSILDGDDQMNNSMFLLQFGQLLPPGPLPGPPPGLCYAFITSLQGPCELHSNATVRKRQEKHRF